MSKILKIMLSVLENTILFYNELTSFRIFSWLFTPVYEANQIKKVCFISLSPSIGLGDNILKNSVTSYIHKIYPESSIVLVSDYETIEKFKYFYLNHSYVNEF